MLRALGRDFAGPFRRAGVEAGRSWRMARMTGRLVKSLYIAFKPVRPKKGEEGPDATFGAAERQGARGQRNEHAVLVLRCGLWLTIGWQLGQVSPDASLMGNIYRGLWIGVAALWAFGMLYPQRPRAFEIAIMAGAGAWALWPA